MSQCYTSRLLVEGVDRGDSGKYVVRAENERGMDMVTVQLLVQGECSQVLQLSVYLSCLNCLDSLSMASVIGVTISLLVVFLIIVVIITISYNQHKLCFKGKPILQVFMFAIDSALNITLSTVSFRRKCIDNRYQNDLH